LRWDADLGGSSCSAPAIGSDGTVYIGSSEGKVYAIQGSGGLAASSWPKFRSDAQNTGRARLESPLTLTISWDLQKVRLEWTAPGVLQSSDALAPGDWQDVIGAVSPYAVQPVHAQRFYRLRRP
jgi:hypothetical protein